MAILLSKHARMESLRRQLDKIKKKKSQSSDDRFVLVSMSGFAQTSHGSDHDNLRPTHTQLDSILKLNITPVNEADRFGHLVIQDTDGRMKPINTYASELLRKLSKKDVYQTFDANQVFLSMQESPQLWYNVPIIYLKAKKADTIRTILGLEKSAKYAALVDFLDPNLNYKLGPYLDRCLQCVSANSHSKYI